MQADLLLTDLPIAQALAPSASAEAALSTLLRTNWGTANMREVQASLQVVAESTQITDIEWLMEICSSRKTLTLKQIADLFNEELISNAKPFLL